MLCEFRFDGFDGNEIDVLPYARQFFDSSWLPADWYLNRAIEYRWSSGLLFGAIVDQLGFVHGAALARLLLYACFAFANLLLFRALGLRFPVGVLCLYLFLDNQSLVAGEWMVGGADAKTLAYGLVIAALAGWIAGRRRTAFACLGGALSLHVLVGLYATVCLLPAALLGTEGRRAELRATLASAWALLPTGAYGLWTVAANLAVGGAATDMPPWEIYSAFRVPHHVLPDAWDSRHWMVIVPVAALVFLWLSRFSSSRRLRFLAAYAVGSLLLFALGLAVHLQDEPAWMRFYWFRFPDVMVPYLGCILAGVLVDRLLRRHLHGSVLFARLVEAWLQGRMVKALAVVVIIATVAAGYPLWGVPLLKTLEPLVAATWHDREHAEMLTWIADHAPTEAVILASPAMQGFYVWGQRAVFVTFKHMPQSAADIGEWYRRIVLCNGEQPVDARGFDAVDEIDANFQELTVAQLDALASGYGVTHYLAEERADLPLARLHEASGLVLYALR